MAELKLIHSNGEYKIITGHNILSDINKYIPQDGKKFIISDENVFNIYGARVTDYLNDADYYVIKSGEEYKNLNTVNDIYSALFQYKCSRSDYIVALGGGVVGDIAGFTAATYLRGIGFIQLPTTLLAQVDSSIGGKTGVDLAYGKNLVGAFHQPSLVISDSAVLETLPSNIYADGFGEIIKYACIFDDNFFNELYNKTTSISDIIYKCIKFKTEIVIRDEFEKSERISLNFGHTVGHAIEKYYNYTGISHGAAVSIGMVYAAKLSYIKNLCSLETVEKIINILKLYGLPVCVDIKNEEIIKNIFADKKRQYADINFILLERIGKYKVEKIPYNSLTELLNKCNEV